MRNSQLLFVSPVLGDSESSACSLALVTPSNPYTPMSKNHCHYCPHSGDSQSAHLCGYHLFANEVFSDRYQPVICCWDRRRIDLAATPSPVVVCLRRCDDRLSRTAPLEERLACGASHQRRTLGRTSLSVASNNLGIALQTSG